MSAGWARKITMTWLRWSLGVRASCIPRHAVLGFSRRPQGMRKRDIAYSTSTLRYSGETVTTPAFQLSRHAKSLGEKREASLFGIYVIFNFFGIFQILREDVRQHIKHRLLAVFAGVGSFDHNGSQLRGGFLQTGILRLVHDLSHYLPKVYFITTGLQLLTVLVF